MCTEFHRTMRQKNDEMRLAEQQRIAINWMKTEQSVVDDATQNTFNIQLLSDLERLKNIDIDKHVMFSEDKIKEETAMTP